MPVPPDGAFLTPRELQCIELLAGGLCFKEIAVRMGVHTFTIYQHLRNARAKYHACNNIRLLLMVYMPDPPKIVDMNYHIKAL